MDTSTLRPLKLGELLDQAFRLYRRNFITFVGIIALPYIPFTVVQAASSAIFMAAMSNLRSSDDMISSPFFWLYIMSMYANIFLQSFFVGILGTAAMTNATSRSHLNQKISILDSYRQLGNSWLHLSFAMIVATVISSILSIWMLVPIAGWFTGLGAAIFLTVATDLLPPITVIEKSKWLDPIKRAWDLARRRFWWLVGVWSILALFSALIILGPTVLISSISSSLTVQQGVIGSILGTLISNVLGGLLAVITLPIFTIAKTIIYFDLRIRTEGFDLALATLEAPEGAEIDVASLPIPPSNQKWLTWDDVSKFAIITLVILGVIALLVGIAAILLTIIQPLI